MIEQQNTSNKLIFNQLITKNRSETQIFNCFTLKYMKVFEEQI